MGIDTVPLTVPPFNVSVEELPAKETERFPLIVSVPPLCVKLLLYALVAAPMVMLPLLVTVPKVTWFAPVVTVPVELLINACWMVRLPPWPELSPSKASKPLLVSVPEMVIWLDAAPSPTRIVPLLVQAVKLEDGPRFKLALVAVGTTSTVAPAVTLPLRVKFVGEMYVPPVLL